jgi:hypothetical protein
MAADDGTEPIVEWVEAAAVRILTTPALRRRLDQPLFL